MGKRIPMKTFEVWKTSKVLGQIASSNACPSGAVATQAGVSTPVRKSPSRKIAGRAFS